jgi:hypothetical protein
MVYGKSALGIKCVFHFYLQLLPQTLFVPVNMYRVKLEMSTETRGAHNVNMLVIVVQS